MTNQTPHTTSRNMNQNNCPVCNQIYHSKLVYTLNQLNTYGIKLYNIIQRDVCVATNLVGHHNDFIVFTHNKN